MIRLISQRQIDDVSPGIPCEKELLERSNVFYVIPKFNGIGISENPSWCKHILSLNKTIRLHGVYHTYNEFEQDRNEEYLQEGINEFKACFGLKLNGYFNQITHKVYHCNNSNIIPNKIIDLI